MERLTPPDTAWLSILSRLREERTAESFGAETARVPGLLAGGGAAGTTRPTANGVSRAVTLADRFLKGLAFSISSHRFQYATVAALIVVVTFGLVYLQPWGEALSADQAALDRQTLAKLDEARWHYEQAINALSEAMTTQQGSLNPQVAQVFRENLRVLDQSIEVCRQAVRNNPRDLEAQYALMASYKQKVQLMTEWVMAQSPSQKSGGSGSSS